MRRGDDSVLAERVKKGVSYPSTRFLKPLAVFLSLGGDVGSQHMELYPLLLAEITHEPLVAIRLLAAQAMIDVSRLESERITLPEHQQRSKHSH